MVGIPGTHKWNSILCLCKYCSNKWASARQNLSSGFLTKRDLQTSLLSNRDQLYNGNFACSTLSYDTFHLSNNKGTDQTVRMRRIVCAFVVCNPPKTGFLALRPVLCIYFYRTTSNLPLEFAIKKYVTTGCTVAQW